MVDLRPCHTSSDSICRRWPTGDTDSVSPSKNISLLISANHLKSENNKFHLSSRSLLNLSDKGSSIFQPLNISIIMRAFLPVQCPLSLTRYMKTDWSMCSSISLCPEKLCALKISDVQEKTCRVKLVTNELVIHRPSIDNKKALQPAPLNVVSASNIEQKNSLTLPEYKSYKKN
uniref:Uncharacterized protein n=1 Tax=Romanomermis culicivorax TaxID=13658 RepID=A0A915IDE7_ROMCU